MDAKLIITFDPAADAIYVRLTDMSVGIGETTADANGVIVDTDKEGNPRGFGFLAT